MELEFEEEDWVEITEYLSEWDDWRRDGNRGRPQFTDTAIYLVPLIIALSRSEERLEKLTEALLWLTGLLTFLTILNLSSALGVL